MVVSINSTTPRGPASVLTLLHCALDKHTGFDIKANIKKEDVTDTQKSRVRRVDPLPHSQAF